MKCKSGVVHWHEHPGAQTHLDITGSVARASTAASYEISFDAHGGCVLVCRASLLLFVAFL